MMFNPREVRKRKAAKYSPLRAYISPMGKDPPYAVG
jgi:hypothetical protein